MVQLGVSMLTKMRKSNPLTLVEERESEILKIIREKGQVNGNQPHRSPLNIILLAQYVVPFPVKLTMLTGPPWKNVRLKFIFPTISYIALWDTCNLF